MAASDAAAPQALGSRVDRPSPLPAAQSKRDRKRQVVMERLAVLTDKFQHEKDSAYRDQLHRIQIELGKIQNIDPYADDAVDVASQVQREYKQATGTPGHAENARSLLDMAGMQFPQFMSDLQDVLETRDYTLAQSKVRLILRLPLPPAGRVADLDPFPFQNEYDRKMHEYKSTHTFKVATAKREHEALSTTMRDRLINQLNSKKARLSKEKEAFEISDTNALFLNPAHFSLASPGSPGGHTGKRSTRHRKETDDGLAYGENKKRKRNGGDDEGSPAPTRRALEANATTPYWQSEKARNEARKHGAVYTVTSLFTEKELAMHYNTAALAAHHYILRHRVNGSASSPEGSDSGSGDNDVGEGEAPPSAPVMERQVSHATRSTRGAASQNPGDDKVHGIEGVGSHELAANLDILHSPECPPRMPQALPMQYAKNPIRNSEQSSPGTLSEREVTADLQIIAGLKHYDSTRKPGSHLDNAKGIRKTLEAVAAPHQSGRLSALVRASREIPPESFAGSGGVSATLSNVRNEDPSPGHGSQSPNGHLAAAGGVAMSRQSTAGSGRGKARRG